MAQGLQRLGSQAHPHQALHTQNQRQDVNCADPRAFYDEGKRMAETLCYGYARTHDVSVARRQLSRRAET